MQRFSHKASSFLEKKIFKGFYHIWAWRPSWSMDSNHFSNLSFPCHREAPNEIWATLAQRRKRRSHLKFPTYLPYKSIGKQIWPRRKKVKCQCTTINYFSYFSRPPIPDNLCKDSATKHPWFWRRIIKVFTIYGHGGHLGQWKATILAIFQSPAPVGLQMKFKQHWPRGSRGEVVWNFEHFFHTNA